MVIGGSDFDKSVNIMLPNLLQMHGSYVVVDADGIMMTTTKKMFKENGYEVKVFDLNNVLHSNHYNPFMYIRDEDDVKIMASSLTENTEDDLWENTKEALLQAIIFYLVRYKEKDDQTLTMLAKLLKLAKTDLPDTYSQLDKIFDEVRVNNKDDICVKKYDEFKLASSKTTHAIITYLADKFRNFDDEKIEVGSLTSRDDMEFEKIGDRKTIVYIVLPTGNTQNGPAVQDFPHMFIVRTMLTQMSSVLFRHVAEDCKELKLNHDICFMLDAFINIGYIPNFYVTLSGMKKNDLSSMIFIPSIRRLRNHDEEYWDCFIESCDALVYLGGESQTSTECLNSENAKCLRSCWPFQNNLKQWKTIIAL